MNLLQRCKAPTPKKNRKWAKILGIIGAACASVLGLVTAGVIILPVAVVTGVTIGAAVLTGAVVHNIQKVEVKNED